MKKQNCILFDLDGTLTASAEGIIRSALYALKKNGITETDMDRMRSFVGPPLTESFQKYYGVSDALARFMVDDYREYFDEKGWKENSVYPGIPEALKTLRGQGYALAVATSKPEPAARRILAYFHLDICFDLIAGASLDETRSQKGRVIRYALENLEKLGLVDLPVSTQETAEHPEQVPGVLMVGDRSHDVVGAKENGLPCLGVLYGYGSRQELTEAGAAALCPSVAALPEAVNRLLEKL